MFIPIIRPFRDVTDIFRYKLNLLEDLNKNRSLHGVKIGTVVVKIYGNRWLSTGLPDNQVAMMHRTWFRNLCLLRKRMSMGPGIFISYTLPGQRAVKKSESWWLRPKF